MRAIKAFFAELGFLIGMSFLTLIGGALVIGLMLMVMEAICVNLR